MNPAVQSILEALARIGAAALEKVPEVRAALAPYLHARARLTVRVDVETDGPGGPLPDPVVEVQQAATISVDGLRLDGAPTFNVRLNGAE